MELICLDLEGVLIPEIWINFAEKTGIDELRATTRDIPDYDELMRMRLRLLDEHGYGLPDIQAVIDTLEPLEGAREFVEWARENFQLIILSDTFYEFARPLMKKLGWPTLFCHRLEVDGNGRITDYKLRQKDPKRASIKAFHFELPMVAVTYNDTTMLSEAEQGILFHAPDNVIAEFHQFPAVHIDEYLNKEIVKASPRDIPM